MLTRIFSIDVLKVIFDVLLKLYIGAGEMARGLNVYTAIIAVSSLILSTHTG